MDNLILTQSAIPKINLMGSVKSMKVSDILNFETKKITSVRSMVHSVSIETSKKFTTSTIKDGSNNTIGITIKRIL